MRVSVRTFANLRDYAPGHQAQFGLVLAEGARVADVLAALRLPEGSSAETGDKPSPADRLFAWQLVLTGLLDTSGYAADVQAKYQGFLITEVKLNIEGSELAPGEYEFRVEFGGAVSAGVPLKMVVAGIAMGAILEPPRATHKTRPIGVPELLDFFRLKLYLGIFRSLVGLRYFASVHS